MPAADAELVAAVQEDVGDRNLGSQDDRVVVRHRMEEGAEVDLLRLLRCGGEEGERARRDRELRKEEVLDHGIRVVAEPVGVLDLLEDLPVQLGSGLPRPALDLRIEAELHALTPFP
jgi:hypothetical protein